MILYQYDDILLYLIIYDKNKVMRKKGVGDGTSGVAAGRGAEPAKREVNR